MNPQPPLSRAELLRAARDAKATLTVEPTRTTVERGLRRFREGVDFVGNIQDGWNGFHFAAGDFPSGAGFSYGLGFTDLAIGSAFSDPADPNRFDFEASIARSNAGYHQASAELTVRNIGGGPFGAAVRGTYYEFPEEDFFGLGPASREQDRTTYLLESRELEADAWWEPLAGLRAGTTVAYVSPSVGSGQDRRFPSAEERFRSRSIPGFLVQPDFGRLDGWIDYDTRDNALYPRAGGFYQLRFSEFNPRGISTFDFHRVDLEAQYHIPITEGYRVIALRAQAVLTDADVGDDVPFFYQPTLGGKDTLRGFREFRFRDRNSLLLTAEYRWQAWRVLEPALFIDAGKVAPRRADVDLSDLEVAYGIGFRFHTATKFVARLDLAKSREGFIPFLRFDHVF